MCIIEEHRHLVKAALSKGSIKDLYKVATMAATGALRIRSADTKDRTPNPALALVLYGRVLTLPLDGTPDKITHKFEDKAANMIIGLVEHAEQISAVRSEKIKEIITTAYRHQLYSSVCADM